MTGPQASSTQHVTDLRALPPGTLQVRVERVAENSHQRGGERTSLGRESPQRLPHYLRAQGPGRYRITCMGAKGHYLKGGSCVVEITPSDPTPRIVPARRPRDYRRSPSPAATLKHQARRGQRRLADLAQKLEDAELAKAALERESVKRAGLLLTALQRQQATSKALDKRLRAVERRQAKRDAQQAQQRVEVADTLASLLGDLRAERALREAAEERLAQAETKVARLARRVRTLETPQLPQGPIEPSAPTINEPPNAVATMPPAPSGGPRWLPDAVLPNMIPRNVGGRPRPAETEPQASKVSRFLRGRGTTPGGRGRP